MWLLFPRQVAPPEPPSGGLSDPSGNPKAPAPPTIHSARYIGVQIGYVLPFGICSLFVVARLYARKFLIKSWGADDSSISCAWIFGAVNIILSCIQSADGVGSSTFGQIDSERFSSQLVYFRNISFLLCLSLTKISTSLFYRRVFDDFISRIFIHGTIGAIVIYTLIFECLIIFQCTPVSKGFDSTEDGTCLSIVPTFYAISIMNIVSDVWLIIFVIPRVLKLRMPKKQKKILICVITLSWMVVVAAVVRLVKTSANIRDTDNASRAAYSPNVWVSVEMSVGLFCVSAPCVKPVLQKYVPGFLSSFSSSENYVSYASKSRIATYVRSGRSKTQPDDDAIELHSQPDLENSRTWESSKGLENGGGVGGSTPCPGIRATTIVTMSSAKSEYDGKTPQEIKREFQQHYYEV